MFDREPARGGGGGKTWSETGVGGVMGGYLGNWTSGVVAVGAVRVGVEYSAVAFRLVWIMKR